MMFRDDEVSTTTLEPLLQVSQSQPLPLPQSQRQPQQRQQTISLSFPLCISYSCIGMIMSLPSTALLYFVNTYLSIPVSLFPLYFSIGFLPYSLKPSYAYITTLLLSLQNNPISSTVQTVFLLFICGLSYIVTAFLPRHAILLGMILAFVRSITLAWPNFLLDLSLLDEVDAVVIMQSVSSHEETLLSTGDDIQTTSTLLLSYSEIAATFQSQAATYRSIGCVVANIVALLLLALPNICSIFIQVPSVKDNNDDPQQQHHHLESNHLFTNHRMFQFILIVTGMLNFICAICLWNSPRRTSERQQQQSPIIIPQSSNTENNNDEETSVHSIRMPSNNVESTKVEPVTRKTTTVRLPSYDSIEEDPLLNEHYRATTTTTTKNYSSPLEMDTAVGNVDTEPLLLFVSSLRPTDQNRTTVSTFPSHDTISVPIPQLIPQTPTLLPVLQNRNDIGHSTNTNSNDHRIWLVILLQLLVALLAIRSSMIQHMITKITWTTLVTILTILFLFCAYHQTGGGANVTTTTTNMAHISQPSHHQQQEQQLRVGLYLILRYSIPSVSYLMSSYIYTVYKETPSILQLLSLLDMCVTTVACYTYSKYLSQYSSGQQILWLVAITTILSGISSFGNIFLIRLLHPETVAQQNDDHSSMTTKIIWTIIINAIIGFFSEWKFFPDVVLATVSITSSHSDNNNNNHHIDTSSSLPSNTTGTSTTIPSPNGKSSTLLDRTINSWPSGDPLRPPISGENDENTNAVSMNNPAQISSSSTTTTSPTTRGVQYGTLLSCIDFGDQIGLLLTGPLIAIFHTTRGNNSTINNDDNDENANDDWSHLEILQIINSCMILLSAFLILILVQRRQ